jgi:tetratricopeptide (TPR) repeat protein
MSNLADGLFSESMLHMQRNDLVTALDKLNEAVLNCAHLEHAHRNKYLEKRFEVKQMLLAKEKNESAETVYKQGVLHLDEGEHDKAQKCFERAYFLCESNHPKESLFLNKKIECDKLRKKTSLEHYEAEQLYAEAIELIEKKSDYFSALEKLNEAAAKLTVRSHRTRDLSEKLTSKREETIKLKKKFMEENKNVETLYEEAVSFLKQNEYAKAEDKLNQALRMCADDYLNRNKFLEKRYEAAQLRQADENNQLAEKFFAEAIQCMKQNDFLNAEIKFNKAYFKCSSGYVNESEFLKKKNEARLLRSKQREAKKEFAANILTQTSENSVTTIM